MNEEAEQRRAAFVVLEGLKDKLTFACPWCGAMWPSREVLESHWDTNPRCKANRRTSNQTQTKYNDAGNLASPQGEPVLNKVRRQDCDHPADLRQPLYAGKDAHGQWAGVIGYQCTYCYELIPIEEFEPSVE